PWRLGCGFFSGRLIRDAPSFVVVHKPCVSPPVAYLRCHEVGETSWRSECIRVGCLLVFFLHLHQDLCPRSWRNCPLCCVILSELTL
uniref:Uncharacterized protein n=1 Tax=Triticum urartu TaxID=4572 RepID=A0A8R7UNF9_TRIUA